MRSFEGRRALSFTAGPSGPPFDPEGQLPTIWVRTSWSTGSEGEELVPPILLGKRIVGEQRLSQTQVGIVQVRVQDVLVETFGYFFRTNKAGLLKECVNFQAAGGFVNARVLGQDFP